MSKLVVDTSPLQALHRCGALALLEPAFEEVWVPEAVRDETRASRAISGAEKVPDLDAHPFIRIGHVGGEELAARGAVEVGRNRGRARFQWMGKNIDRPELEVVALAERLGAVALVEDAKGMRCARARAVPITDSARVLCDLEAAGLIADAAALAKTILATGFYTEELLFLSRGIRPKR